jgi:hypothetical protein
VGTISTKFDIMVEDPRERGGGRFQTFEDCKLFSLSTSQNLNSIFISAREPFVLAR